MSSDPRTPMTDPHQPVDELPGKLKRTELQRRASSIPGREIVQVLTEIPAGVESGSHIHPGEEVGFIVAGTVEMMIREQETLTLHSGDGFLIPPRSLTTPSTSVPRRVGCSPPTSSRWGSRWPRSSADPPRRTLHRRAPVIAGRSAELRPQARLCVTRCRWRARCAPTTHEYPPGSSSVCHRCPMAGASRGGDPGRVEVAHHLTDHTPLGAPPSLICTSTCSTSSMGVDAFGDANSTE
jgi:hypothetical protein